MSKQNALLAWGTLKGGVLLRTGAAASRGRERVCWRANSTCDQFPFSVIMDMNWRAF